MLLNNSKTDPNQLLPIRYPWARQHYKTGVANNWVPEEIPMADDVEQWKSNKILTPEERKVILWNLGFFSTAESLTANNIVLAIYKHITDPACRQYLLRQAYEESIHSDTFVYCCDTLGLNPEEIYGMYKTIPQIKEKDEFVTNLTRNIFTENFDTTTTNGIQSFLRDLIGFYVILEGIFFYCGFAIMAGFRRRNKMTGVAQQFEMISKDEALHLAFGNDLIQTIIQENPQVWTDQFKHDITRLILDGAQFEKDYAKAACPRGIVGLTSDQFCQYIEYIVDKRLDRLNLMKVYHTDNPFDWMSGATDLLKEKNFFETRVTEYSGEGTLEWD